MALTFRCPQCKGICAFAEKHAGRQARCTRCQTHFIIPANSGDKALKIKLKFHNDGDAVSGFYKAVFIKSWWVLINPKNLVGLIAIAAVVFFKYFMACRNYTFGLYVEAVQRNVDFSMPFGKIVAGLCWGALFWYYMEIINSTAFEVDDMPEPKIGGLFEFISKSIASVYAFAITLIFVGFPCIVTVLINKITPVDITPVIFIFAGIGFFLFPMAILSVSVNRGLIDLFHIDRLILPIRKVFRPYLTVAGLVFIAAIAEYFTVNFDPKMLESGSMIVGANLAAKLFAQIPAIIAVRSIGLLYRHYGGFLL